MTYKIIRNIFILFAALFIPTIAYFFNINNIFYEDLAQKRLNELEVLSVMKKEIEKTISRNKKVVAERSYDDSKRSSIEISKFYINQNNDYFNSLRGQVSGCKGVYDQLVQEPLDFVSHTSMIRSSYVEAYLATAMMVNETLKSELEYIEKNQFQSGANKKFDSEEFGVDYFTKWQPITDRTIDEAVYNVLTH